MMYDSGYALYSEPHWLTRESSQNQVLKKEGTMRTDFLIEHLQDEKKYGISGGIYHMTQIDMAYNSNHMEGSTLTHEQTRYIYETHSLNAENVKVDDVIETTNHFRCFDMILDNYKAPLTEDFIKSLHYQLKNGTFSSHSKEAVIGDCELLTTKVASFWESNGSV